ncbi:MAG TPA: hypothetical protein VK604_19475 [Bryobacteraceae bacterium]|nr:hypothetical protein [Bryobacteraceae bacterium]HTF67069.1 hypothetical protein [Edaphobacter sp.]
MSAAEHPTDQKGGITVSTITVTDELEMSSSSCAQMANAAERQLGAFPTTVGDVFGNDKVEQAADLWIRNLEAADCIESDTEKAFRQITIQTAAQLARGFHSFRFVVPFRFARFGMTTDFYEWLAC